MMTQAEERAALEKLLVDTTVVRDHYWDALKTTATQEQSQKLQHRLHRYEAVRTLITDLMLG